MIDIGKDLQDAFNDGYKQGKQDEWIPLKRKWPDRNGHYLVTYREWSKGEYLPKFDNTKVKILRYHEAIFRLPKCIDEKAEKDMVREVLAWQPLPEPYKQLAADNNVVTKSGKDNNVLTIGDKIRESNRSLAYMLGSLCSHGTTDIKTFEMRGWTTKKWLDYLNQPHME